jgi:hypothetical protein
MIACEAVPLKFFRQLGNHFTAANFLEQRLLPQLSKVRNAVLAVTGVLVGCTDVVFTHEHKKP